MSMFDVRSLAACQQANSVAVQASTINDAIAAALQGICADCPGVLSKMCCSHQVCTR